MTDSTRHPRRLLRLGLLLVTALLGLPVPGLAGEGDEADGRRRADRDVAAQVNIERRLQDLETSMGVLADELEKTGHTYEAGLIRAGMKHLAEADVSTAIRSVLDALKHAKPQTQRAIDQSRQVLESLQRLLLILEDRNREFTRNEILDRLEAAKRAAATVGELARQEADLVRKIENAVEEARSDAARPAPGLPPHTARGGAPAGLPVGPGAGRSAGSRSFSGLSIVSSKRERNRERGAQG